MSDVNAASSTSSSVAALLAQLRQQFLSRIQPTGQDQNSVNTATQPGSAFDPTAASGAGSSAASGAGSATAGVTGTNPTTQLSPSVLTLLILTQTQSSTSDPSAAAGTTPDASGVQSTAAATGTDGTVSITEQQLEQAVTSVGGTTQQADALFNQLQGGQNGTADPSGVDGAQGVGHHGHHYHGADGASGAGNGDPLAALVGGTSTAGSGQTVTNADGSSTTTLTYADGTTVTLTTPATNASSTTGGASAGSTAANTNGSGASGAASTQPSTQSLLTTLIQIQEQAFQPATLPLNQAA